MSSVFKREYDFLDALGEEVLILDTAYKIVYANQKFLESRGKSLDEVKGRHCYQVLHNLDKPCHMSGESCPLNEVVKNQIPDKIIHSYEDKDKKRYFDGREIRYGFCADCGKKLSRGNWFYLDFDIPYIKRVPLCKRCLKDNTSEPMILVA